EADGDAAAFIGRGGNLQVRHVFLSFRDNGVNFLGGFPGFFQLAAVVGFFLRVAALDDAVGQDFFDFIDAGIDLGRHRFGFFLPAFAFAARNDDIDHDAQAVIVGLAGRYGIVREIPAVLYDFGIEHQPVFQRVVEIRADGGFVDLLAQLDG